MMQASSPRRDRRLVAAAILAVVVAEVVATLWPVLRPGGNADVDAVILGARALIMGRDPYQESWAHVGPGWPWPLHYPLPALLVVLPLSPLPLDVGRAVFSGVAVGLLAFGLTRQAWWPLLLLVSGPVLQAAALGQWSPLVTAAAWLPALGWALACKPNLGLAVWLGSRDAVTARRLALAAVGAVLVSLVISPRWPLSYLASVGNSPHRSLVLRPFGWLLLLACLAWRTPAARVLLGLALVPQSASFYDALPALLAARRRSEAVALSAASTLGYLWWLGRDLRGLDYPAIVARGWPVVLLTVYLPALAVLLRPVLWKRAKSSGEA
jgi:hypothetical protein